MIECPACKQVVSVEEFLEHVSGYKAATDSATFKCPSCQAFVDVRVEAGRISLGYIYAAGEPHFAGMVEVEVPGLACAEGVSISYGGRTWGIT